MITRAMSAKSGKLVVPEAADEIFKKGDYICPYCEVPLTPVIPDEENKTSFWRIYPGQNHLLGYCRTIAEKEGRVHSAAAAKEKNFFLNDKRPEKGYPYPNTEGDSDDIESALDKAEKELDEEGLTGDILEDLAAFAGGAGQTGEDMDFGLSRLQDLIGGPENGDERDVLVGQTITISHPIEYDPNRTPAETAYSQMGQLWDEHFHESKLTTPMFGRTRGDYMVLKDNLGVYLENNGNAIRGFLIVGATFAGYSIRDKMLLFEVTEEFDGPDGRKNIRTKARIQLTCSDENYYNDILLLQHFVKKEENGRFGYKYRKVNVWIRGKFDWTPADKCSTCKYRDIHRNVQCGNCIGLAAAKIKTSTQILFTDWVTNENKHMKRINSKTIAEVVEWHKPDAPDAAEEEQ